MRWRKRARTGVRVPPEGYRGINVVNDGPELPGALPAPGGLPGAEPSYTEDVVRLWELDGRLREELRRYGLPEPEKACSVGAIEGLLRHVYNNRDTVYGIKDLHIEFLSERLDAAYADLAAALDALNKPWPIEEAVSEAMHLLEAALAKDKRLKP